MPDNWWVQSTEGFLQVMITQCRRTITLKYQPEFISRTPSYPHPLRALLASPEPWRLPRPTRRHPPCPTATAAAPGRGREGTGWRWCSARSGATKARGRWWICWRRTPTSCAAARWGGRALTGSRSLSSGPELASTVRNKVSPWGPFLLLRAAATWRNGGRSETPDLGLGLRARDSSGGKCGLTLGAFEMRDAWGVAVFGLRTGAQTQDGPGWRWETVRVWGATARGLRATPGRDPRGPQNRPRHHPSSQGISSGPKRPKMQTRHSPTCRPELASFASSGPLCWPEDPPLGFRAV